MTKRIISKQTPPPPPLPGYGPNAAPVPRNAAERTWMRNHYEKVFENCRIQSAEYEHFTKTSCRCFEHIEEAP